MTSLTANLEDRFCAFDAREALRQISPWDRAATSGGRATLYDDALVLPVARGYSVVVRLEWDDTYTVQRVYTRSGVSKVKGEMRGVYFDTLSNTVYLAGCYHHSFPREDD